MSRFEECLEELNFLKSELKVQGEEYRRIFHLNSEIRSELNTQTKKISQIQNAIQILEQEKAFFESGGSKDKFVIMQETK